MKNELNVVGTLATLSLAESLINFHLPKQDIKKQNDTYLRLEFILMGSCFLYLLTRPCSSCSVDSATLGLASFGLFSITSTVACSCIPSFTTLRVGFALDSRVSIEGD
jgi:hypothetical protein